MPRNRINSRIREKEIKREKGSKSDGNIQKVHIIIGSRQLEEFQYTVDIIHPPYEPKDLLKIVEESDSLKQNIQAMATNIASFGHGFRYDPDFDYNNADTAIKKEADKEWEKLKRIFKYINPIEEFKDIIEKMIIDRESIGWGTIEAIRNGKGDIAQIEYCRACNIRLAKADRSFVAVEQWQENEQGEYEKTEIQRRFKKFVQMINGQKVYFKEFGDPRTMNLYTGLYEECSPEKQATEIIYYPIHASYTDYGVPRWVGVLINATGSRASEILNYNYFTDGRMIPAAITVDGGKLTQESIDQIRQGKGIDNAYKLLVIETTPYKEKTIQNFDNGNTVSKVETKIQPLTSIMNQDALYQEYQKQNKEKIRDTFRLPPIYTGASADYNKATSEIAKIIAEEQIFIPEREKIMSHFNTVMNNELGIKYIKTYLKGPKTGDLGELAKALEPYIKAGTVTPNMLIDSLGELLGKEIEVLPEEIGNKPFELVKLEYQNKQQKIENSLNSEVIQKSQEDTMTALYEMVEILKSYLGDTDEE